MVSIQAYNKLKAHLNILLKKHQAFKDMVINSGENFLVGQLSNPQIIDNKTTKNKTVNINEYDMVQSIESIFKKEQSDLINTDVKKIVCENYFLYFLFIKKEATQHFLGLRSVNEGGHSNQDCSRLLANLV